MAPRIHGANLVLVNGASSQGGEGGPPLPGGTDLARAGSKSRRFWGGVSEKGKFRHISDCVIRWGNRPVPTWSLEPTGSWGVAKKE
jgi:hypothetical protein